jgi:hypothetical protein
MSERQHPNAQQRWRGVIKLVADAVIAGSNHIENVQLQMMDRPLQIIDELAPSAKPVTAVVRWVHKAAVVTTHTAIRGGAAAVDFVGKVALP